MLTIVILLLIVAVTGACLDHRRTETIETTEADRDSARVAAELRAITGLREHG
ncbi:hypothetical protein [Nocardia aurantia]|uniref:Uncharacterized protein n=1 Tax=Nocardia aurantia TaxID=2585199 RepID=A0A7K0DIK5_9NOCA|nr:hypothetical protein [Nocardia aurantia]MQY25630.1 hypothetical protein [Nocardia aurantia]